MRSNDEIEQREEFLREALRTLSDAQRREFYTRFNKQVKDPDTYAALNYLFIAGLHHFYLGKRLRGAINLGTFCVGLIFILAGVHALGIVLIVAVLILELRALFKAQAIVQDFNNDLTEKLIEEIAPQHLRGSAGGSFEFSALDQRR